MREIKFRAYHKSRKEVFRVLSIDFLYEQAEIISLSALDEYEGFTVDFDEVELMQYTGLNDKNGKEIYEGDLLEDEEKQLWEVVYEKCQYILVNVYMPGARFIDNDLEVIGNIYEDKLEG